MEQKIQTLQGYMDQSTNIVFFGGAGVSTESGLPDFRGKDGLYQMEYAYPPEEILSHEFFFAHTEQFFRFYRDKMLSPSVQPNIAHYRLAELEKAGKLSAIVTQNIDGLHQAAGSKKVYELHGTIHRNHCISCGRFFGLESILTQQGVPHCPCGGIIKPDVVLYGENLDERTMEGAIESIAQADLLVVGGTSLSVYPAAGLLSYYRGAHLVLINQAPTPMDDRADLLLPYALGDVFRRITT